LSIQEVRHKSLPTILQGVFMTIAHNAQAGLARSDAYRLLAACFYEPEKEMFLEENLCANLARILDKLSLPGAESCGLMEEDLKKKEQQELLVEYSALFLGPFNPPAQPYGSIYLEDGRRLMGDSAMEAQKLYAEAGVQYDGDDFPDHIAIELEFMSFLEQRIAQALSEANQADLADFRAIRSRFFTRLLAPWAPLLGKAMIAHTEMVFYRALGECLIAFIGAEMSNIAQASEVAPTP